MSGKEYEWKSYGKNLAQIEEEKKQIEERQKTIDEIKKSVKKIPDRVHQELKECFLEYGLIVELYDKGFDVNKLDEFCEPEEFVNYLQPFFIDKNGKPLDQHAKISCYYTNGKNSWIFPTVKTQNSLGVLFSDEYGSKNELLKKGYVIGETMFPYPYYNGKWNKDGYRVGELRYGYNSQFRNKKSISKYYETEKSLYIEFTNFREYQMDDIFEVIRKSNKKNIIINIAGNGGGDGDLEKNLVDKVKKFKNIYVISDGGSTSASDELAFDLKKEGAVLVGKPTAGAYYFYNENNKELKKYNFSYYTIEIKFSDGQFLDLSEGDGIMPHYYTEYENDALEIIKILSGDKELYLPQ